MHKLNLWITAGPERSLDVGEQGKCHAEMILIISISAYRLLWDPKSGR